MSSASTTDASAVLATDDLTIRFGGHVAVDGGELRLPAGHADRHRRPQRRRQDHLLQPDLRPAAAPPPGSVLLDGVDITGSARRRARTRAASAAPSSSPTCSPTSPCTRTCGSPCRRAPAAAPTCSRAGSAIANWIERADQYLERRRRWPTSAQSPAAALPHGDQRKLEVAILMALEPHVFMFDEPTAGMTVDDVPVILDLIKPLKGAGDKTILLVEHKMDVVRSLADRIVVLHNGQLVADGEPAEVIGSPVVQEAYLGVAAAADALSRPAHARRRAHPHRPVSHPAGRRLRRAARRHDRAARPQRRRQDHDAAHHHGPVEAAAGRDPLRRPRHRRPGHARHRAAGIAYVPETMGDLRRPHGAREHGPRGAQRARRMRRGSTGSSASSRR